MSKIRSKNTSAELLVFKELRKMGVYFQKHYNRVRGTPDIALPKKKRAVFIDGDFWHGWQYNRKKQRLPKVYWRDKIETNIRRDKRNRKALKKQGWDVLRVWEHQLKNDQPFYLEKIRKFLLR